VTTAALRAALPLLGLLALGCRKATEPETPAGASLVATVFYDAGGTSDVSGTWYAPTYLPTAPRFRVAGYAEVPYQALCDLP
jgi:hypothetical protein